MSDQRTRHRRPSGAIRKLPSGRWQARYTGPDGALRTLGTYATKVEADQSLAHEVSRMARGLWRDPRLGEAPLGQWFREWIETRGDIAESTRGLYRQVLDTWIDAELPALTGQRGRVIHLGGQTLASVTPADVREWDRTVLAESTRRVTERWHASATSPTRVNAAIRTWAAEAGTPLSPTGRIPDAVKEAWLIATGGAMSPASPLRRNAGHTASSQAYRLLHAGMAQAVEDGAIVTSPCAIKGASQRDAKDRAERRPIGPDDLWALAAAMPARYGAAVVIAFCSGLRAGELFALQRKHVDLAAGTVRVEQSLARPGTSADWFSSPKTRAGRRTVVLPATAVRALEEHLDRFAGPGRDALVFGTTKGTPLSTASRTTMFARARRAIGRDDLTWHDQRHSAMTIVAGTGATLPELMQRAGHASARAALHYQHAADDSQRRVAERLDRVLSDGRP